MASLCCGSSRSTYPLALELLSPVLRWPHSAREDEQRFAASLVADSLRLDDVNQPTTSGSLDTGFAMVMDYPVNLRGSLDALPQEGSYAPERSASSVDQLGCTHPSADPG